MPFIKISLAGVMLFLAVTVPAVAADMNKVLRIAFKQAESGFDPVQVSDLYSATIIESILEPMLSYDYLARPAKLIPNTLEAMPELSESGATYLCHLKKGIYFSADPAFKGKRRELVAADYAFSLRRLYDPKLRSPWLFFVEGKIIGADAVMAQAKQSGRYDYDANIPGIEVIDRYTLRIRLKEPDFNFLYVLATPSTSAFAHEVVEAYGDDIQAHPVGTGPFVLKQWTPRSKIVLEANPGFRTQYFDASPEDTAHDRQITAALKGKQLPLIGRVEVYPIDEPQPRWLAFLNKEHDYIERVPNEYANIALPGGKLAPNLVRQGIQLELLPEIEVTFTYFNMEDPAIGGYTAEQIALRRAICLGYNNIEELQIRYKNQAIVAQSPVPPGAGGYDPHFKSPTAEYNLAKAKALLDLFGYIERRGERYRSRPDGSRLSLEIASPPTSDFRVLDELWKKSMDALGIRVTFRKERWEELVKAGKKGKLQIGNYLAWHNDYPDGENFLQLLYGPNVGQSNEARFNLPQYDRLYEQSKKMPDSPERTQIYQEMTKLILVYAPWRLGVHRVESFLSHPWVIGNKKHPVLHNSWKFIDLDVDAQRRARE
jgi:oligopeptide transport system substrate-binding protein